MAGHKCLTHPTTGRPQCSNCEIVCPSGNPVPSTPICATDGQTYASWCALRRASCVKGVVLETRHAGRCGGGSRGGPGSRETPSSSSPSSSSSSSSSPDSKFIRFPPAKIGRRNRLSANRKKLSKKERRARRRMQRRLRLQAKAALLAETRKNGGAASKKKFSSRRNGAKPFKHPQSSLAVKRAAPANNQR